MPSSAYPLKMLQTISTHLYRDRGFRGNTEVCVWVWWWCGGVGGWVGVPDCAIGAPASVAGRVACGW